PRMVEPFIDYTPNIQWTPALRLFFVVVWDIVVANIKVAKLVLGPTKNLHPKWFRVPLDTEHEEVNALLAMIITTTPGTVTAGIDQDRGDILVHALSTQDEAAEIETIKQRYEQPLIQILVRAQEIKHDHFALCTCDLPRCNHHFDVTLPVQTDYRTFYCRSPVSTGYAVPERDLSGGDSGHLLEQHLPV